MSEPGSGSPAARSAATSSSLGSPARPTCRSPRASHPARSRIGARVHGQLAGVRPVRDRDRGVAGCEPDVRQAEQHHPDDHQGNDPTGGVDPLCLHDDAFPRSCGRRGGSRHRLLMSPMPKRDFVGERHAASFRRFEVGGGTPRSHSTSGAECRATKVSGRHFPEGRFGTLMGRCRVVVVSISWNHNECNMFQE